MDLFQTSSLCISSLSSPSHFKQRCRGSQVKARTRDYKTAPVYTLCSLSDGALRRFRFEVYLFGSLVEELSWHVCLVWTKKSCRGIPRPSSLLPASQRRLGRAKIFSSDLVWFAIVGGGKKVKCLHFLYKLPRVLKSIRSSCLRFSCLLMQHVSAVIYKE